MGGRAWTEAEDQFLRDNYKTMTNKEMAAQIGRTESSVQVRVNGMGLTRPKGEKSRHLGTYRGGRQVEVGDVFGRLRVESLYHKETEQGWRVYCSCVCECGTRKEISRHQLSGGHTNSCGCLVIEAAKKRLTKHGLSKSDIYRHWVKMRDRCNNPNHDDYHRYGGRGITVCEEWDDFGVFHAWAEQNGHFPGCTIDRKDNDLGYTPDNCRFVDSRTQANNHGNNRLLTVDGETKTVSEWSTDPRAKVCEMTIRYRIGNGWSDEEAVLTPPGISPNRQGRPSAVQVGDVYGELTILETWLDPKGKQQATRCRCQCSCGRVVEVWAHAMRQNNTVSCGHLKAERAAQQMKVMNAARKGVNPINGS